MAGNFTYDGFLKEAQNSGLLEQFSQADLSTAEKYPEFGYSLLSLKKDFGRALTTEEKLLINQTANQLRSSYANYTGGPDGSEYISGGKIPGQIDDKLDQINGFTIPEDPTAEARKKQLDEILNRGEFSWSKEEDPLWPVYKKQYLREGERATANALGQAAAATGGRPSSYAVGAATQAGDYYATKLNDIIPTLYQEAYNKYLQDYNMDLQGLQALNGQQAIWRQGWQDQFGLMESQLSDLQGQDAIDYARYLDQINLANQKEERDYQRGETVRQTAAEQVAAILQAGGIPSNELLAAAGLTGEYAQAVHNGFQRAEGDEQQALAQEQVDAILQAGGMPSPELIAASGYSNEYVAALANAFKTKRAAGAANGGQTPMPYPGYYLNPLYGDTGLPSGDVPEEPVTLSKPAQAILNLYNSAGPGMGASAAAILGQKIQAAQNNHAISEEEANYLRARLGIIALPMENAAGGPITLSKNAQSILDAYHRVNPGTVANVAAVFSTRIRDAQNSGTITSEEADYLRAALGITGGTSGSDVSVPQFTNYQSAVDYMKKQGVPDTNAAGALTESEWNSRRSSYERNGTGDTAVTDYKSYSDYLTGYVQYCLKCYAGK